MKFWELCADEGGPQHVAKKLDIRDLGGIGATEGLHREGILTKKELCKLHNSFKY